MNIRIKTDLPGPKSEAIIKKLKTKNIAYSDPYPFVHSNNGNGCYFQDIDGNIFLDFASQVASNPLGYNHPNLRRIVRLYSKKFPIKYAGQDFTVKEQLDLLNELMTITPRELDSAFLINSGAEAVENSLKLAMRRQQDPKFGIAFHGAFHGRCYDEKTEVLTENGWKLFKDLNYDDRISTLNLKNMNMEYEKPIAIVSYPYKGNMVKINNFSMDMLVTPNHRMVVIDRKDKLMFCEASKLKHGMRVPRFANWEGIEMDYFTLPSIEISIPSPNGTVYTKKMEERRFPMDSWLKFYGIWIADGWTSSIDKQIYSVGLTQKDKESCMKIEDMLEELKFKFSKDIREKGTLYRIKEGKQLWSYLQQFGKSKNKFIPNELKNLPINQLKTLLKWMCMGDGTVDKSGRSIYFTSSKRLADDVQEIFLKIGSNARIYKRKRRTNLSKKNSIFYEVRQRKRENHEINLSRNNPISEVYYEGKVYCCEVPNHVIYVRRNGYPLWCGNSLGALSCTDSNPIQKESFLKIPIKHFDYDEGAVENIEKLAKKNPKDVGFVIMETIQGEGGYNIAPKKLLTDLRKLTKRYKIPFIIDEVQSGLGRTGKWWAFQHFNVTPDIFSSAKALQVGAAITSKKFSLESGSISSTWGGGHILDLALGLETIRVIKKNNLLKNVNSMGNHLMKRLNEIKGENISNIRGKGLMIAFDLQDKDMVNDFVIECLKTGLVVLATGKKGVRLIPPYIVSNEEMDQAISIIENSIKKVSQPGFRHKGEICNYLNCGETIT